MDVICPECGCHIPVETRAPVGSGTQSGKRIRKLNANKVNIVNILLLSGKKMTVKDMERALEVKGIKRYRRGEEKNSRPPSGEWGDHEVQAELSLLKGGGFIQMETAETPYDPEAQGFIPQPKCPVYWA